MACCEGIEEIKDDVTRCLKTVNEPLRSPCTCYTGKTKLTLYYYYYFLLSVPYYICILCIMRRRLKSTGRSVWWGVFISRKIKNLACFNMFNQLLSDESPLHCNIIVILHHLCVSNRWCDSSTSAEIDVPISHIGNTVYYM